MRKVSKFGGFTIGGIKKEDSHKIPLLLSIYSSMCLIFSTVFIIIRESGAVFARKFAKGTCSLRQWKECVYSKEHSSASREHSHNSQKRNECPR